jgi:hypothetical protein
VSEPLDKLTEIAGAAANPLNAAKSSLEAARGVLEQGEGLVNDVRGIAERERERREKREDERAIRPSKTTERASKRVAGREMNRAVADYNAATETAETAAKAAYLRQLAAEEEHHMIWSMGQAEREAYFAQKKAQTAAVVAEKLRIIREEDARQERFEMWVGVITGIAVFLAGLWFLVLWIAWLTGDPILLNFWGIRSILG